MIINKDELKKMITKSVLKSKTLKIKLENEIYLVKPGSIIIIRCFYDPIMETGPVWVFRRVTYEYVAANGKIAFDIGKIYKKMKEVYWEVEDEMEEMEL